MDNGHDASLALKQMKNNLTNKYSLLIMTSNIFGND